MRRIILFLLLAAAPALAQAPQQRELTITNRARQPIREQTSSRQDATALSVLAASLAAAAVA